MRTALDLDRTALEAARQLATHRAQSLGSVVLELILKGLRAETPSAWRAGFPVFNAPAGKAITFDDVKGAEDDAGPARQAHRKPAPRRRERRRRAIQSGGSTPIC